MSDANVQATVLQSVLILVDLFHDRVPVITKLSSNVSRRSSSRLSSTICFSLVLQPAMKLRCSFFNWNFNTCSTSIRSGLMQFLHFMSILVLKENTLLQGTKEA